MLDRRNILTGGLSLAVLAAVGAPARAEAALRGQFVQGTLIRGKTDPGASVSIDGKKLTLSAGGDFAFGFAYDRTAPAEFKIRLPDSRTEERTLTLAKRDYKIQNINGLPDKFVDPPQSVLARIERDNKLIGAARARDTDEAWFADDFGWPVRGPVTGVYGSQRILNGVPKRPHFGVDIAAGEGRAIHTPVGAIVAMAEKDLYFTGGTVILDHGRGISTSYLHMSRLDVKVGDRLAKGDPIGAIGKTGRATGPHLCWRLNWFQERLDAALVVPEMPG
ncbi:MAG: M23 family metallopeptidase [Alphaproteobacteria bacterium]|nr:M23 family metallopeptidase [Alphaproteobacteria bacterium]